MIDLRAYATFAEVVQAGSMSAAARRLGMSPSAVSQIIGNLEQQMGVRLLNRSTRRLSLTEAGARCHPHSLRVLEAGRSAAASLEQSRDAPIGELRIAAPVGFASHIVPALAPVLAEWPGLRLNLLVDDALIDLVAQRIDLAVRVGGPEIGGWNGTALGDLEPIACAAPAYLERRGPPRSPADLVDHDWLALRRDAEADRAEAAPLTLSLSDGSVRTERVSLQPRATSNNQVALQQMCEQGMGLACLFRADARAALERGALQRVLPGWRLPGRPMTLVTPRGSKGPAKARVGAAAITRYFAKWVAADA